MCGRKIQRRTVQALCNPMKNDFDYIKHVNFIKFIYAVQCALILCALLVMIFGQTEFLKNYSIIESFISLSVSASIFYGIKAGKSWVIILVLLVSYWGIIDSFLVFLEQEPDILVKVVRRALAIVQFIFELYKIKIFSKVETKRYFREQGITLIT